MCLIGFSPIAFKLNVVTSDALTDVFVFPPSSKTSFTYETKRLVPLSVLIDITNESDKEHAVPLKKAQGTWKVILNTSAKDTAVSVQVTASVGPLADGSIRVHRHPKLQALETQAQHLMDGGHFVDDISADPRASNHRKIFIFPLDFKLELGKVYASQIPSWNLFLFCSSFRFVPIQIHHPSLNALPASQSPGSEV